MTNRAAVACLARAKGTGNVMRAMSMNTMSYASGAAAAVPDFSEAQLDSAMEEDEDEKKKAPVSIP